MNTKQLIKRHTNLRTQWIIIIDQRYAFQRTLTGQKNSGSKIATSEISKFAHDRSIRPTFATVIRNRKARSKTDYDDDDDDTNIGQWKSYNCWEKWRRYKNSNWFRKCVFESSINGYLTVNLVIIQFDNCSNRVCVYRMHLKSGLNYLRVRFVLSFVNILAEVIIWKFILK